MVENPVGHRRQGSKAMIEPARQQKTWRRHVVTHKNPEIGFKRVEFRL